MEANAVECAVCLEVVADPQRLPDCSHSFCKDCVRRLCSHSVVHRCPLCRRAFRPSRIQSAAALGTIVRSMWPPAQRSIAEVEENLLLGDYRVPLPFVCALVGKRVVSGRRRTSKWVVVDDREKVPIESDLLSVLESQVLTGGYGWTLWFADGSS